MMKRKITILANIRLSVVCLSSVKRSCALLRRLKFSAMFLSHLVRWLHIDIQSYMSFQLVPKSVTSNELEQRNGRYIAPFH